MSIIECLGCNKAIIQTEGKRAKKWCSEACRKATYRRSIPDKSKSGHKVEVNTGQTLKRELAKKYPSLTVMERLFYRPASDELKGEHNFVSLPGRACYGVFE